MLEQMQLQMEKNTIEISAEGYEDCTVTFTK